MANIYLRVPSYLAQFYRNREVKKPLTETKPVTFSPFQAESVIMAARLTLVPEQACEHNICFSQRMWQNMMRGKRPQGGRPMFDRDTDQWLSLDEVNALTGVVKTKKYEGSDYLCIQTPKTVVVGRQYKQVTASFNLSAGAANELVRQLRTEFIRILLGWVRRELALCDVKGIRRDVVTCIDHFFYHYNIMIGINPTDRDSMRRMAMRWLEDAKMLPDEIDDEDVLYIYEREREKQGVTVEEMMKSLTSDS